MKPKELIDKVARKADTSPKGSHIPVADVSRVYKLIFAELSALSSDDLLQFVGKEVARSKAEKKKAKAKKK